MDNIDDTKETKKVFVTNSLNCELLSFCKGTSDGNENIRRPPHNGQKYWNNLQTITKDIYIYDSF